MTIDALKDEMAALESGLASEFWATLAQHVTKEWGAGGERYQSAIEKAAMKDGLQGVEYLRMVIFAKKEIDALFNFPAQRLQTVKNQLRASLEEPTGSRRGPGL